MNDISTASLIWLVGNVIVVSLDLSMALVSREEQQRCRTTQLEYQTGCSDYDIPLFLARATRTMIITIQSLSATMPKQRQSHNADQNERRSRVDQQPHLLEIHGEH